MFDCPPHRIWCPYMTCLATAKNGELALPVLSLTAIVAALELDVITGRGAFHAHGVNVIADANISIAHACTHARAGGRAGGVETEGGRGTAS